jgi:hypothetical protein
MKSATLILTERFMLESGISAATLARLTGISPSTLRDALRSEGYLGAEREARILETASRVAKFKIALEPLDLPREWMDLASLLESTPEQVRECVGSIFQRNGDSNG